MERYCGYLQAGLRSRSHPWANLSNRVLHKAYLEQIDLYYDLENDLTITSKNLRKGERVFEGCEFFSSATLRTLMKLSDPQSILRPPYKKSYVLDATLKSKIARYFSAVMNGRKSSKITNELPNNMPSWGKVRVAGGGDRIRIASGRNSSWERNMSYVRVSFLIWKQSTIY
jgi:hypothetical protein